MTTISMNESPVFNSYFNNAKLNNILVMQLDGTVLDINGAFAENFGYDREEIKGKNFSILFTKQDRKDKKPELELASVIETGQAMDESYILNSSGQAVWSIGESLLVENKEGQKFIVKDVINLQAKRQLRLFLMETDELLEHIFESSKEVPMMVLDGSLKVLRANPAFRLLFELDGELPAGSRLSDIAHPFWQSAEMKKEVSSILINNERLRSKEFRFQTQSREDKVIKMDSRIIEGKDGSGRQLFLLIEEAVPQ